MNGQSYHYSDSGNGTPTPSSTSYPASLSSQSSRDTSPSRLPPNLNHINAEKSISTSIVPNSYSTTNYKSPSSYVNSNLVYNQLDNSTNQPSRGYKVPTSVMYNTTNQAQQSPYRQVNISQPINSNPVPKSPYNSTETNHLSNDKNHLVSQFNSTKPDGNSLQSKSPESPPSYNKTVEPGYPGFPGGGYDQEGYRGDMYAGGGYRPLMSPVGSFAANNGQENYGGQTNHNNYSYPQPGRQFPSTPERRPDQPISSGPPRTNALGIIPYATEPVMSQGSRVMPGPGAESPGGYYSSQQQVLTPPGRSPQQPATMAAGGRPPRGYPPPPYQPYPTNYPQQQAPPATLPPYSPTQSPNSYYPGPDDLANQMSQMSVTQSGYNKLWGRDAVDLLKSRDILPPTRVEPPPVRLSQEYYESANCSPDIFRCTLTKIPETKSLLDKSRLPLGVLIHPFKDLNQLSVIQCTVIVRCRACRTYINPFVYFVDSKHWKCNLCFRVNDLPDEFQYDPLTKTYGDPSRRPEIKSATIEFIASSEYMVRPPQPACYVFVLDVSRLGAEAGYLRAFCDCLLSQLEALPGDSRTAVAFITFDSTVHYYSLADSQAQPHQMVIVDIDDMFVPCPDNLLVNLSECLSLVRDLLRELPNKYRESYDTGSALGSALQAAYKLLAATGGRVTVFQCCLSITGPGKLSPREDPSQRSGDGVGAPQLNPITDFYKKMALDCSGQQIAVDLFLLNSQYADLASLSGVSRFSGGCIHHFPLFNAKNPKHVDSLQRSLQRYLCRKIGFESVMRLRCTRGLSIHTFHGNFFVRSTDLLSLPNVNPDAGFGMQVSIDENLSDVQTVCFQAALLYTSSKGERRIRVHTLCLPVASNLSDVLHGADQQCIIGLLAKMAVDRCHQSSLGDAREAFVNVVADMLSSFRLTQSGASSSTLLAPSGLALLPLYVLALLKYVAFRVGQSTRLDDRVFAMCQMKSLPLSQLIQAIYPDLYPLHNLTEQPLLNMGEEAVPHPPLLHLSAERIDSQGVYLMDDGAQITIYIGHNVSNSLIISMFGAPSFSSLPLISNELAEISSQESKLLRAFVSYLQNEKSVPPTLEIIRDDSPQRQGFVEKLIEDKTESGHSYYEFLQRVKVLVK